MNTLVKWNKNTDLFNELSRGIFNDLWTDPFFGLSRGWRPETQSETDKEYILEIELPRVKKHELKCEATDSNTIVVSVTSPTLNYKRAFGFSDCDAEKAVVELDSGVLSIKVPKVELPEPKCKVLEIKDVSNSNVKLINK